MAMLPRVPIAYSLVVVVVVVLVLDLVSSQEKQNDYEHDDYDDAKRKRVGPTIDNAQNSIDEEMEQWWTH
jgi:hypothetical protein